MLCNYTTHNYTAHNRPQTKDEDEKRDEDKNNSHVVISIIGNIRIVKLK